MGIINFFLRNKSDNLLPPNSDFYNGISEKKVKILLIRAIKSNNKVEVQNLIENFNAPVDIIHEGNTLLRMCILQNNFLLAKYLLVHNATTTNLITPAECRYAIEKENMPLINFLIKDLHFDVNNYLNDLGQTFLTTAVIQNKSCIIEYLLKRNDIDLDQKNSLGLTALDLALKPINYDLAKLLLIKGATLNKNQTILIDCATKNEDFEFIKYMHQHNILPHLITKNLNPILEKAIYKNKLDFIKYFISEGINVDTILEDNITPLLLASKNNNLELIQYLISAGANINAKDMHCKTPLVFAIEEENIFIIKYLVAMGANVNAKFSDDTTPLMIAAMKNNLTLVSYLISAGADVYATTKNSKSVLTFAVEFENISITNYLLDNVKDLYKKCDNTLLHTAIKKKNFLLLELLVKHNIPIDSTDTQKNTPLILACKLQDLSCAQYLLKHNAKINVENSDGDSPLTIAINSQNLNLVKTLIDNNADVNLKNNKDIFPLVYAFKTQNIDIINCLIKNNVTLNKEYIIDGSKTTPLIEAIKMGSTSLVKSLILHGADVNLKTSDNISPLDISKKYNQSTIKYYLLRNRANGSFFEKLLGKILLLNNKFKNTCFKFKNNISYTLKKYIWKEKDKINIPIKPIRTPTTLTNLEVNNHPSPIS